MSLAPERLSIGIRRHFTAPGVHPFDQVAWAGCLLVLVKLLNGADQRWWLAFGAIAGIGLLNKNTLVLLAIGLIVAVAVTPSVRPSLRSPLPWAGGLLAVAIASPYLIWQTVHGWPMLDVAGSVSDEDARKQYPGGWTAPKPYLRIVPQPKG